MKTYFVVIALFAIVYAKPVDEAAPEEKSALDENNGEAAAVEERDANTEERDGNLEGIVDGITEERNDNAEDKAADSEAPEETERAVDNSEEKVVKRSSDLVEEGKSAENDEALKDAPSEERKSEDDTEEARASSSDTSELELRAQNDELRDADDGSLQERKDDDVPLESLATRRSFSSAHDGDLSSRSSNTPLARSQPLKIESRQAPTLSKSGAPLLGSGLVYPVGRPSNSYYPNYLSPDTRQIDLYSAVDRNANAYPYKGTSPSAYTQARSSYEAYSRSSEPTDIGRQIYPINYYKPHDNNQYIRNPYNPTGVLGGRYPYSAEDYGYQNLQNYHQYLPQLYNYKKI